MELTEWIDGHVDIPATVPTQINVFDCPNLGRICAPHRIREQERQETRQQHPEKIGTSSSGT
jgi:hypothetical protein